MDGLILEKDVKREIDEAEAVFLKSFERLLILKHRSGDIENAVLKFQPELAECLYGLMTFYRKLKAEARDLISRKTAYSRDKFSGLMAQNKKYMDMVKKTIEIGKSLGDAFVWLFYQSNLSELIKHFEHESTGLFVIGTGGLGEIEFIKHTPILNGCLVLYHGITSMLRIGDFSLYGFGMGIVGIGELKSQKIGPKIQVNAHIISKIPKMQFNDDVTEGAQSRVEDSEILDLAPNIVDRLKKQLLAQEDALHKRKADVEINKVGRFEYNLINELEQSDMVLNEDKSLLLLATKSNYNGLFEVLNEEDGKLPDGLLSMAEQMILPNNSYNGIIIGKITTAMAYSRKPILWWEILDNVCRDIYFGRLQISTVFNPAQMIQHYVDKGYSIVDSTDMHRIKLRKVASNYQTEFGNFEQIFDLISHSLLKTKHVIEMYDQAMSDIENGKFSSNTKIDFITYLPYI